VSLKQVSTNLKTAQNDDADINRFILKLVNTYICLLDFLKVRSREGFATSLLVRGSISTRFNLNPVYTTLNFWYGTDKIGTRTTFLVFIA
jgi:hypothetical protein